MLYGRAVCGPNRTNRILYGLIFVAMFMSFGHHIDHVIRGNHVGWPLTGHATPFTYTLGVYPLILLVLYLYASGRVGPGYWASLSGWGVIFVAAIHFGPSAVEPPADIINLYEPRIVGWLAFGWLVVFVSWCSWGRASTSYVRGSLSARLEAYVREGMSRAYVHRALWGEPASQESRCPPVFRAADGGRP
jgi:hypothetical protein